MDTEGADAEIFKSDLYQSIVRQQISDAQFTQNQLDKYYQDKVAQLEWLRGMVSQFAYDQDSKRVQENLLAIVQDSYQIKSRDVSLLP